MKYTLLTCAFVFLSTGTHAQNPSKFLLEVDSLVEATEFEQALRHINSIVATTDTQRDLVANKRAEVLIGLGNLDEAQRVMDALAATKWAAPVDRANYLTNLGFLFLNKGRHDLAMENLQQGLVAFQQNNAGQSRDAAKCLSHLSLTYFATGKYNQAQDNGRIALQVREQLFGPDHESVAASYNDLGLVYSQTDPDAALEYYEKALATYKKLHGQEHPKIAIASTNIGTLYATIELYGDAIVNLENALKIWRKIYPGGHPNEAFVLRYLGSTYVRMGNNKTALTYSEQALAQYKKSYGEKHPEIASAMNQIGALHLSDGKYDLALDYFQQALCANVPGFESRVVESNPGINKYYNPLVLVYSLQQKAVALEEKHFGETLKLSDLKLGLATLLLCDSLIDDIRHHSADEADKISLGALANEVYEDGVRIGIAMSEMTSSPRHYREISFYFAEKSKSAVLQESIADAQAKTFAGIPPDLVDEEKDLKSAIALLSQRLSQKPSQEEEKYLRESLFTLDQEYAEFTRKLENDYPDYYNLKFNTAPPSVGALQAQLRSHEAIVSYFVAEKSARLYQFVLTSGGLKARNSALPENFDRFIKGLNNSVFFRDFETYKKCAELLAAVLRPRVRSGIRELVIVPSGRLGTIPFEALPLNGSSAPDFASVKYLADRFAVSYEFSVGLIAQKNRRAANDQSESIFLCAPVSFPAKDNLSELPGTELEVNNIARLFTSGPKKVILREEANESTLKSDELLNYDYLHFATHGVVDEADPELSRIFLQENAGDDGHLFAGEIYNLKLNADLAVLSACQTGLGKYSKGEGVIGLSRALVYAGARNLIVSFWSVADESTALLMADFYRLLLQRNDGNFREALRQAKVRMITEKKFSEPYFWAPFVLIGF